MWVNITGILSRGSKATFSYPKHLQGKLLPSTLNFSLKVFNVLHSWIKSIRSKVLKRSSCCYALCILGWWVFVGLFVCSFTCLFWGGFFVLTSFYSQFLFLFFPLEVRHSGFVEMIPFLLLTCAPTLQPHGLQGISRGKVELCLGSCEVTATSREGKAHRNVLCTDRSLSFAEICSTPAANYE